jgi:hypothetical protein
MKYQFKALPDYLEIIEEKLENLCKKFNKFPQTIVNINTKLLSSGWMRYDIEILTPEVKYKGYSHVATLKIEVIETEGKTETVNMVFPSKKYIGEDFSKYYQTTFRCDHCHTIRNRLTVHLFRNDKTNEDLMIASSCARAYFGENIYKLLGLYELLTPQIIEADFNDIFEGRGYRGCSKFNTREYCKLAYGIMRRTNTYISKRKKEEMEYCGQYIESTQNKVDFLFRFPKGIPEDIKEEIEEQLKEIKNIAKDFDITSIKNFWYDKYQEKDSDNFKRSCFLNLTLMKPKLGMLVYAVSAYMREVEGAFSSDIGTANSQHVGSVGVRLRDIKVTVGYVSLRENNYGLSTITKFLDEKGNIITWFASKKVDLTINQEVFLTGTVKKHDEFRGKKQTLLSRCKISLNS